MMLAGVESVQQHSSMERAERQAAVAEVYRRITVARELDALLDRYYFSEIVRKNTYVESMGQSAQC